MRKALFAVMFFMMISFFLFLQTAFAHRLYLKLDPVPQKVTIKCHSWFEGGAPCGGEVSVYEECEEEKGKWRLLSEFCGKMDEKGDYEFGPVGPGKYKVVVERIGHRAERIIEVGKVAEGVRIGGESIWERGAGNVPLVYQIFSGFGYLLGIAGIAIGIQGYRMRKKGK